MCKYAEGTFTLCQILNMGFPSAIIDRSVLLIATLWLLLPSFPACLSNLHFMSSVIVWQKIICFLHMLAGVTLFWHLTLLRLTECRHCSAHAVQAVYTQTIGRGKKKKILAEETCKVSSIKIIHQMAFFFLNYAKFNYNLQAHRNHW